MHAPTTGDVGVRDGVIVSVGGTIDEAANETIDADGAIVTPGWVDVHTHYDGQVSWDDVMDPSAGNGATTIVMGNCGVGFAPVRPGGEQTLIELMEGVEDIPGTALYEGMEWGQWESFPDYMDYIASRRYSLDIGAQVAHGAVRYYVMGERGSANEDATADDIDTMAALVAEAVEAGAVGFSTSRTIGHRSLHGAPVPGTFAPVDELVAIAEAMGRTGKGVFELIPAGTVGKLEGLGGERFTPYEEFELMRAVAKRGGRPVTFTLVQSPDYDQDLWREILDLTAEANADGAAMHPQVSSRPIGFVTGPRELPRLPAPTDVHGARPSPRRRAGPRDGQAGGQGGDPLRGRRPRRRGRLDGQPLLAVPDGRADDVPARAIRSTTSRRWTRRSAPAWRRPAVSRSTCSTTSCSRTRAARWPR